MGGGIHGSYFYKVISVENLFSAWREFSKGKRSKIDVSAFELNLESNLFALHETLASDHWHPDPYTPFYVQDPKLRLIHKATVRDRVLYQAVYRVLYQVFDSSFIYDVYSSRDLKGTHAGVDRFNEFSKKVSANFTQPTFALKCDIRKFFDSIDHTILFKLISEKIKDEKLLNLIHKIIDSFHHTQGRGLPLGNVTSQLFANVYMNEFDQFIKHAMKTKYYLRYCDDFVILSQSRIVLVCLISQISDFLTKELRLELHPRKIEIRKVIHGVDFLGYVSLPHYKVLRTGTKKRMIKKIAELRQSFNAGKITKEFLEQSIQSYLGMLSHCKGEKIRGIISPKS